MLEKLLIFFSFLFIYISTDKVPLSNFIIENNIINLDDKTYDDAIESFPHIFILLYSNNDKYSLQLLPEFNKAAKVFDTHDPKIVFGRYNGDHNNYFFVKYEIATMPSLVYCHNNECFMYTGKNNSPGIITWLKKKTIYPLTFLNNYDSVENFINDKENNVAVYFGDHNLNKTSSTFMNFLQIATSDHDNDYAYSNSSECLEEYSIDPDTVVLFRKNHEVKEVHLRDFTIKEITDFINHNAFPSIMKYNEDVGEIIFIKSIPNINL